MMISDISKADLEKLYIIEKKSTCEISLMLGCDSSSVHRRLKKLEIAIRNKSQSHLKGYYFNGDLDVLYGSLLGDGGLVRRNKRTNCGLAYFAKGNVNYDHVFHVGQAILGSDPRVRIKENPGIFRFSTLSCQKFLEEYERWYKNEIKIVPKDLLLNSKIVLHWFLDDGSTSWHRKSVELTFASESFSKDDNEFLINQLCKLGINANLQKINAGTGYRIGVYQKSSVKNFFDFIGPCPVGIGSLFYKWKIPETATFVG